MQDLIIAFYAACSLSVLTTQIRAQTPKHQSGHSLVAAAKHLASRELVT